MSSFTEKLAEIKAIKLGLGIQYVLNEAYKIFGNPILIHDMDYKLIVNSECLVNDDPIWVEYVTTKQVKADWLEFFKNEDFLDTVASAKKITYLLSDKLKYKRIFGKIFAKNNTQIGASCIVECHKPFDNDAPVLFEAACEMFNREFALSNYYYDYGQQYITKLMTMIIEGSIFDKLSYTAHVESLNEGLKQNLFMAVIDTSRCNSLLKKEYFKSELQRLCPNYKFLIYEEYIVILLGLANPQIDIEKGRKSIVEFFTANNLYAGVSKCFDNLFELGTYYKQAKKALLKGIEKNEKQPDSGWLFLS